MENCKPIFVVGMPNATAEIRDRIAKGLSEKMQDYHIIVYDLVSGFDYEFNAFYPKELDEQSFEELKEYVLSELKK